MIPCLSLAEVRFCEVSPARASPETGARGSSGASSQKGRDEHDCNRKRKSSDARFTI